MMAAISTMPLKETRAVESSPTSGLTTVLRGSLPSSGSAMESIEEHSDWHLLQRLPMRLTASIPLPGFRVKDLIALRAGQMLTSNWFSTDDVPLKIGSVHLSWSEFEVVEQRMAIRLTRLA